MNQYIHEKLKSKKNIIFDFDGVIFSLDWTYGESIPEYRRRIRDLVAQIDPQVIEEFDPSQRSYMLTDLAIQKHGPQAKELIFKFYLDKELSLIKTAKPNTEIIEFIKNSYPDTNMFIWSNNQTQAITTLLKKAGITNHFNQIIGRDSVELSKPDSGGFDLIFNNTNATLEDFIMIGDSMESDGGAAENSGIEFIHYRAN